MRKFKIKNGHPYPLGACVRDGGVNFSMVIESREECGVILYHKGAGQKERIAFDKSHRIGNISCIFIEDLSLKGCEYNFYIGDNVFVDPYAKRIMGNEKWRSGEQKRPMLRGSVCSDDFDWQGTAPLRIPYHESIMYCLHVRGFTKHRSSGVKNKGTFAGLTEKIPYLKDLGVNAIELMPAYEFEECEWENEEEIAGAITKLHTIEYQVQHIDEEIPAAPEPPKLKRINYWGFKEAFYFAPKASYAAGANPCEEFKRMVRELHRNGIEVIMQFYFPNHIKQGYILSVLKHWVLEYQIDGMHLKGDRVPVTLIATEPLFAAVKILYEDFQLHDIYPDAAKPLYKNLAYYRDEFMYDTRRFLKSDADMLKNFQYHMRNHHPNCGVINYITNYYGFTLNDLVSYDRKHNEPNGENNMDGEKYNYSWNCGIEGPSRKRAVTQLRRKQMRNALSFLFTAQGTPLLLAGDEFGNSQNGNNNCYCQDNDTGWVDWRCLDKNADLHGFVKTLIQFRKAHGILHLDASLSMLDKYGYGYPDLSYHGEAAWQVQLGSENRQIAMMYCGENEGADYLYIAYNMHWNHHRFALPSIADYDADYEWKLALDTFNNELVIEHEKNASYVNIPGRCVVFLTGVRLPKKAKRQKTKKTDNHENKSEKNHEEKS